MDQSEHRTRWPQGQRLRPRIGRKYIRVLTRLTSVGNAACTFDIVTRPENWPTANLRHVSATCAQYGVGPTLVGMLLVPERHHQSYKRLWILWGRLGRTMSRVALVAANEVRQFRANARDFVQLMKRGFPWVSVSPKLHIVLHHAPDFLERFGNIGLYGE